MHPVFRSKLTTVVLGMGTLWLVGVAVLAGIRRYGAASDLVALESRIDDAQRENARLTDELDRMKRPQWLALLARQQLNYKQPDETVVFVYKSEKADTIAPPTASTVPPIPSWRRWLEWFAGVRRE